MFKLIKTFANRRHVLCLANNENNELVIKMSETPTIFLKGPRNALGLRLGTHTLWIILSHFCNVLRPIFISMMLV